MRAILKRSICCAVFGLAAAAVFLAPRPAQAAPSVTYKDGVVTVHLPAAEVKQIVDREAAKLTGYKMNSDSKTAYTKNFRSSLSEGRITVRFDYDAKTRGWTKDLFGGKVYGPWAKDSGWIEFPIFVRVTDWQLRASTNVRDVRLQSNNWFTNWLMQDAGVEFMVKGTMYDVVSAELQKALGGRTLDLRELVVQQGGAAVANATGLSKDEVSRALRNGLGRARLDARISANGLTATVAIKDLIPKKVEKVHYTIKNDSGRTVAFTMQPSGKSYTLAAGQTFTGTSNEVNDKLPTIRITSTGKSYGLTAGNHKFWWMAKENRIGLDLNAK